ncbi:hypothetical protein LXL04_033649 [Taraxacum kok-saghyz]
MLFVFFINGCIAREIHFLKIVGLDFSRSLQLRFGPSSSENHHVALFKLRQSTTLTAYLEEFERLCNFVTGLPTAATLNCFISGLRTDIHAELSIHNPVTLNQAYGVATLIEDKQLANHQRYNSFSRSNSVPSPSLSNPTPPLPLPTQPPPPVLPRPPRPPPLLPRHSHYAS